MTIVYDAGTYGQTAYDELHALLVAEDICVTAGVRINDDQLNTASNTMTRVLQSGSTGVIFFGANLYAHALIVNANNRLPGEGADFRASFSFKD